MSRKAIESRIQKIRKFYATGETRKLSFRRKQLRRLRRAIRKNEGVIMEALRKDLKKPPFESYAAEIGILYPEIRHAIWKLGSWAKTRRVRRHPSYTSTRPARCASAGLRHGPDHQPLELSLPAPHRPPGGGRRRGELRGAERPRARPPPRRRSSRK